METKLIILGKGDNIITMVLDNLYSKNLTPNIIVYNNLNLPILNIFNHDEFNIQVITEANLNDFDAFTLGVYQPEHKIKLIELLNPDINKFINVIHSGADISKTVKLGNGILINSKVSIAAHTNIGNFVSINRHVSIGHHTNIEDYCSINPGVNIGGTVTIGEGTTIGMGSNILHQIKIGKNSVIGAGSLVTKDIPDNVVAYGSPCKVIKDLFNN